MNNHIVLSRVKKPLITSRITHKAGFVYVIPLDMVPLSSYNVPFPGQVLENGNTLGSGYVPYDDIKNIGLGRYSFWNSCIFFSTSDNSDPRINGKNNEIMVPFPLSNELLSHLKVLTFIVTLFTIFLIIQSFRIRIRDIKFKNDKDLPDEILTFANIKKEMRTNFPYVTKCILLTYMGYLLFSLLHKPELTILKFEIYAIYGCAFFICGYSGFYFSQILNKEVKLNIRFFPQIVTLIILILFLLVRNETGIITFPPLSKKAPLMLSMICFGILFFYGYRKYKNLFQTQSQAFLRDQRGLVVAIILAVAIALPGIIKPLITAWDVSGWMDSHMYDYVAYNIAIGKIPEGNSMVMPLYQYGMALLYYIFGHFFYVQQIANVLLAEATVILICLSAWNLFKNLWAVLFAGLLAAFTTHLHLYVYFTQIENWYIPLFCLTIFAWSLYWRQPVVTHIIFLGICAGLACNCRIQGMFYFMLLCLAPFFLARLALRTRFVHFFLAVLILSLTLLPWSIRNYVYLKKFSPFSEQSRMALLLNDHRLPLYAQRYDLRWKEVVEDYQKRYPDEKLRYEAIKKDFVKNTFGDPVWLAKAMFWRSLGFYGLLPPGVWAPEGPGPTDWSACWQGYVCSGLHSIFFITFSLLGLLSRPGRVALFLLLAIGANLILTFAAPMMEPRYGYPVIPLHMLMGLCIFFAPISNESRNGWSLLSVLFSDNKRAYWLIGTFCLTVLLFLVHITVGRDNLHPPLREKSIVYDSTIVINQELRSLNDYYDWSSNPIKPAPVFEMGEEIRLRCMPLNYMTPPKTGHNWPTVPAFASDLLRETYYETYPVDGRKVYVPLSVTYLGAAANTEIREGDLIEVEGTIIHVDTSAQFLRYWIKVKKIYKINSQH